MSDMSSMNRERKKRELKRQMISTPGQAQAIQEEAAAGGGMGGRKKKKHIFLKLLILAVLAAGLGLGARYYFLERQFMDYRVVWEVPIEEGGTVGYESFGTNVLKYTKDGMSYIVSQGETVWIQSY